MDDVGNEMLVFVCFLDWLFSGNKVGVEVGYCVLIVWVM